MNVYDFDGTLYNGDSSLDFVKFCLRKRGWFCLRWALGVALALLLYLIGVWRKERFKSAVFAVVSGLDDTKQTVGEFWKAHWTKLQLTLVDYAADAENVIISASPEFLLSPVGKELGATLIGSNVDPQTGKWLGINCYGAEKVRFFCEVYGDAKVDRFYSDSLSDAPMAELARESYFVKNGEVQPWTRV